MRRRQRRRIGAYGVCHDGTGGVLLTRASARSVRPGVWGLPGGGIAHGEAPADAVVREVAEETGLRVTVVRARDVALEMVAAPGLLEHTDGLIYDLAVTSGTLRPEVAGTTDAARWVPAAELPGLPLSGLAAYTLGMPAPPATAPAPPPVPPRPGRSRAHRGQRFGVYGLVTDPADRVLLTLIADGYPAAGRWHLPGGGTEFGEQPLAGLVREITEESGQTGQVGELLAITDRYTRAARGPEGHPVDWHSVRAVFRFTVAAPTSPRVLDIGGSTAAAGWFSRPEAARLPLTDLASAYLERGRDSRDDPTTNGG